MNIEEIKKFSKEVGSRFYFDHDLKKSNWFNIGGKTKVYFKPDTLADLVSFLKKFGNKEKIKKDLELLVSQSDRCREILKGKRRHH